MTTWTAQTKNTATWSGVSKTLVHEHLLTESGFYLTQENGDHILLESSSPAAITWNNQAKS